MNKGGKDKDATGSTERRQPALDTLAFEQLQGLYTGLRDQLEEFGELITAIHRGAVDAFVVQQPEGYQVHTLSGADWPYRVFVENMVQGALTLDRRGDILFYNQRFADMMQANAQAITGVSFSTFADPANVASIQALLQEGRTGRTEREGVLRTATGTPLSALMTVQPLPVAGEDVVCVVITDLTERQDLAKASRSEESLRQADRRKDEFLAVLAHELRNPLSSINNAVQMLKQPSLDHSRMQWARDIIERQVHHISRLVDDLLDVSRITQGKVALQRESIDLRAVLERALETSRPFIDARKHEITGSFPEEPLYVHGDFVRLTQVVWNLLQNAAKFMPQRGRIRLSLEREGSNALIKVRDAGVGIPRNMLPHIFNLFVQGDVPKDQGSGGLGIGLTLVHSLVTAHGGTVAAFSDGPGRGSEVVIKLPLTTESPQERPTSSGQEYVPTGIAKRHILIVDDHADASESLALLLRLGGHVVYTAANGLTALDMARTFRPHMILLDIGLPQMDGYAVAQRLRRELSETVMLVAVTGYGQPEDRLQAQKAGFDHFLVKPVDIAAVRALLGSLDSTVS